MSAKVYCRMGDGTEHTVLHPTEEAAKQSLIRILETHRKTGHMVSEKYLEQEPRPQYIATESNGALIAMYQIID